MAVDLRLQKFAKDIFADVWDCIGSKESFLPRPDGYWSRTDSTYDIVILVLSRYALFRQKLLSTLSDDYELYSRNGIDCYFYLCKSTAKYIAYKEMNIFDKMLMSCAVVATMGWISVIKGRVNFKDTGPLSWAMYFEMESAEEFHAAGGWMKLKEYAYARNTRILHPAEILELQYSKRNDLETAKELYEVSENWYCLQAIVKTFERRYCQTKCSTCSKCQPLVGIFFALYYTNKFEDFVEDFQLVEGYMQIFLRMLNESEIDDAVLSVLEANSGIDSEDKTKLLYTQAQLAVTKKLHDRIFFKKNWDVSEEERRNCPSNRCGFCGEDFIIPIPLSSQETDSEKVKNLKSIICKTVSEVPSYSLPKEAASFAEPLDEIEEAVVLRLFKALNTEPALSEVKANIDEEFGDQDSVQFVLNSMNFITTHEKERKIKLKEKKKIELEREM